MTISYVSAGSRFTSTTGSNRAVAYPTTTTSGNLLLLIVGIKDGSDTVTTPSGFSTITNGSASGGAGSDGTDDEGTVRVTAFYKLSDGTEGGGTVNVSTTGTLKPLQARIFQFSKTESTWDIGCSSGSKDSGGTTAYSITTSADPGITSGDMVVAASVTNSDAPIFSSPAFSTSGVTYGAVTEREQWANANGTDLRYLVCSSPVSSGTSSGNTTFSATGSTSSTNYPAGPTLVLRLRESTPASGLAITSVTPSSFDSGITDIVIAGSGFGASQGSSTVDIGGVAQTVTSWSNTSITITSARGSNSMGAASLKVTVR